MTNKVFAKLGCVYCTEIISPTLEEVYKGLLETIPISKTYDSNDTTYATVTARIYNES